MKNSDYWKQRFMQLEDAHHSMGLSALTEIEKQYKAAQKELDGQIALWYQKFADNNGITMAEAQTYLQGAALKEFKWDVKEYIKYGKENALLGGWTKELENASAKYHITKLEALKIHTQHSLESLCANQLNTVYSTMTQVFETGYYHTAFELQKGFNIGWDIAAVDQTAIEHLLSKPWSPDKYNFSEKIWTNKNKLISEVHKQLSLNIMTGGDPQNAIDAVAKAMKSSRQNAGRLVMTEEAYFSALSRKECFENLGVEEYEIVATLDEVTSDICRSLDGKVFPVKDFQAGVTAPPFHPWCRSTTAPKVGDDFGKIGERAARDEETGKTYYVPDDIKYSEWENTFVKGGDKSKFKAIDNKGTIHYKHHKNNIDNPSESDIIKMGKVKLGNLENCGWSNEHNEAIRKLLESDDVPDIIRKVWDEFSDKFTILDYNYTGTANYSPKKGGVSLDISKTANSNLPYNTAFHELGHNLDYEINRLYGTGDKSKAFSETYKNGIFGKTLKQEANAAIDSWGDKYMHRYTRAEINQRLAELREKYTKDFEKYLKIGFFTPEEVEAEIKPLLDAEEKKIQATMFQSRVDIEKGFCDWVKKEIPDLRDRRDISDMFEPVMSPINELPFGSGHHASYWRNRDNGKEGFAEMFSAVISNKGSLENIKKYFPKSYEIFEEMLGVIK